MRYHQIKRTLAFLFIILLALTACQKDIKDNTTSAAFSIVNGDSQTEVLSASTPARPAVDPNDVNLREDIADDQDVDNHKKLPHVVFASTNGSFIQDGDKSQIDFHAEKDLSKTEKNVHGQITYKFATAGFSFKGKMTNIVLLDSVTAKVYGSISKIEGKVPADYSFITAGKKFLFVVREGKDNGPKNLRSPDLVSDLVVYSTTTQFEPTPYVPVKGRVEVGMKK